jgi:hypothetical protein
MYCQSFQYPYGTYQTSQASFSSQSVGSQPVQGVPQARIGNIAQQNQYASTTTANATTSRSPAYQQPMSISTQPMRGNINDTRLMQPATPACVQTLSAARVSGGTNYLQLMTTIGTQALQHPQSRNGGRQSSQGIDYLQLMNAPIVPRLQDAPQRDNSNAVSISITRTDANNNEFTGSEVRNATASKSTRTNTNNTDFIGGEARRAAASKGTEALQRFDSSIESKLQQYSAAICPMGFRYYRGQAGYLCGGGNHFVSHGEVDRMAAKGIPPFIRPVNAPRHGIFIPPPPVGWNEPMHFTPHQRYAVGADPIPLKVRRHEA